MVALCMCSSARHVLDLLPNSVGFDLLNHCRKCIPPYQLLNRLLAFVPNPIVVTKAWRLEIGKARHVFKERQHAARTHAHAAGGRMVEKGSTMAERKRERRKRGCEGDEGQRKERTKQ